MLELLLQPGPQVGERPLVLLAKVGVRVLEASRELLSAGLPLEGSPGRPGLLELLLQLAAGGAGRLDLGLLAGRARSKRLDLGGRRRPLLLQLLLLLRQRRGLGLPVGQLGTGGFQLGIQLCQPGLQARQLLRASVQLLLELAPGRCPLGLQQEETGQSAAREEEGGSRAGKGTSAGRSPCPRPKGGWGILGLAGPKGATGRRQQCGGGVADERGQARPPTPARWIKSALTNAWLACSSCRAAACSSASSSSPRSWSRRSSASCSRCRSSWTDPSACRHSASSSTFSAWVRPSRCRSSSNSATRASLRCRSASASDSASCLPAASLSRSAQRSSTSCRGSRADRTLGARKVAPVHLLHPERDARLPTAPACQTEVDTCPTTHPHVVPRSEKPRALSCLAFCNAAASALSSSAWAAFLAFSPSSSDNCRRAVARGEGARTQQLRVPMVVGIGPTFQSSGNSEHRSFSSAPLLPHRGRLARQPRAEQGQPGFFWDFVSFCSC